MLCLNTLLFAEGAKKTVGTCRKMVQVSNSRGLGFCEASVMHLSEASVMHLSEKRPDPFETQLQAPFRSKAPLKSYLLSLYIQTICGAAYRAGAPVPEGTD